MHIYTRGGGVLAGTADARIPRQERCKNIAMHVCIKDDAVGQYTVPDLGCHGVAGVCIRRDLFLGKGSVKEALAVQPRWWHVAGPLSRLGDNATLC